MPGYAVNDDEHAGVVGVLSAVYHESLHQVQQSLDEKGYVHLSGAQLHALIRLGHSTTTFDELAGRINRPIQTVDNLMHNMSQMGYVATDLDTANLGSSSVTATETGKSAIADVDEEQRLIENRWREQLGQHRLDTVVSDLIALHRQDPVNE